MHVLQNLSMQEQINFAMRKISTPALKAGFFNNTNFMEAIREYVKNDQVFTFMNSIKRTPAYWKKFKSEVLAMVKQLGAPTFFLALSCEGLRWDKLIKIMQKLNKADKVDVDMSDLSNHEKCSMLNNNAVIVARYFQYRVEGFLNLLLLTGLLENQILRHKSRVSSQR